MFISVNVRQFKRILLVQYCDNWMNNLYIEHMQSASRSRKGNGGWNPDSCVWNVAKRTWFCCLPAELKRMRVAIFQWKKKPFHYRLSLLEAGLLLGQRKTQFLSFGTLFQMKCYISVRLELASKFWNDFALQKVPEHHGSASFHQLSGIKRKKICSFFGEV